MNHQTLIITKYCILVMIFSLIVVNFTGNSVAQNNTNSAKFPYEPANAGMYTDDPAIHHMSNGWQKGTHHPIPYWNGFRQKHWNGKSQYFFNVTCPSIMNSDLKQIFPFNLDHLQGDSHQTGYWTFCLVVAPKASGNLLEHFYSNNGLALKTVYTTNPGI